MSNAVLGNLYSRKTRFFLFLFLFRSGTAMLFYQTLLLLKSDILLEKFIHQLGNYLFWNLLDGLEGKLWFFLRFNNHFSLDPLVDYYPAWLLLCWRFKGISWRYDFQIFYISLIRLILLLFIKPIDMAYLISFYFFCTNNDVLLRI